MADAARCPNRIGAEYGEDDGPCGDEGRLCMECEERERGYWMRYFRDHPSQVPEDLRKLNAELTAAGRKRFRDPEEY